LGWGGWATDPIYRRGKKQKNGHTSRGKTSWCISKEEQRITKGKLTKKLKKWRNQGVHGRERKILNRMNSGEKKIGG